MAVSLNWSSVVLMLTDLVFWGMLYYRAEDSPFVLTQMISYFNVTVAQLAEFVGFSSDGQVAC